MWTNQQGWTNEEESAFAQLRETGRLERMEAIRLLRRFRGNMMKALGYAQQIGKQRARGRNGGEVRAARLSGPGRLQGHRRRTQRVAHG